MMADGTKQRPLLVETVPGERPTIDWVPIGQAMTFLGSVVVIIYGTMSILAGPGLAGGWEGAWFVPRSDFDAVCPSGLVIMLLGIAVYYYGRRRERRRD
jgi:hypothetical protein